MVKSAVTVFAAIAVGLSVTFISGCESDAQKGAGIGAVGGGAGYIVGNEQDKKKATAERNTLRQEMNTVTVNITNSNGSVSQVLLRKQGVGYVGPRGEYYNSLPTEEQLRPVYGF